ncbi:LysR family transcriptional regulator [Marinomonas sp.]|nr:LysR family transcriptional regulator [Marinomonas sp.]MDB4838074.1 LysR family transcriptional regulator [Marinomonas sp.]
MLDDLLLFVEVARRGSYSKAAMELKVTAPTLSKRIQALEETLGDSVFIRSARGVTLTNFGAALFEQYATPLLDLQSAVSKSVEKENTAFTLHCPQNLMLGRLFPALEQFSLEKTEVNIAIEATNSNVLLSQTTFDLAIRIGEQKDSGFYQKRIGEVAVCLAAKKGCLHINRLILPYSESQTPTEVVPLIAEYQHVLRVKDITLARELAASGVGVAMLPMTEIKDWLDSGKSEMCYQSNTLFTRPMYALWANKNKPTPLAAYFISLIEEQVKSTPELQGKVMPL